MASARGRWRSDLGRRLGGKAKWSGRTGPGVVSTRAPYQHRFAEWLREFTPVWFSQHLCQLWLGRVAQSSSFEFLVRGSEKQLPFGPQANRKTRRHTGF